MFGNDVFAGFANGVASDGTGGNATSTIVDYSLSGQVKHTYSIVGGNDGLRVDPSTGLLWILQNQDGNAALDILDKSGNLTGYTYSVQSTTSGYDDIVFKGGTAYFSATNPASATDTVLYSASTTLPAPGGAVQLTPILSAGNLVDTDSLALTPGGDLLLDDQGGGATPPPPSLTKVTNPGALNQKTTVVDLVDATGKGVSVDDTRFAPSGSTQLLVADNKNTIYSVTGDFTANGAYTATKGAGYVGSLDLSDRPDHADRQHPEQPARPGLRAGGRRPRALVLRPARPRPARPAPLRPPRRRALTPRQTPPPAPPVGARASLRRTPSDALQFSRNHGSGIGGFLTEELMFDSFPNETSSATQWLRSAMELRYLGWRPFFLRTHYAIWPCNASTVRTTPPGPPHQPSLVLLFSWLHFTLRV